MFSLLDRYTSSSLLSHSTSDRHGIEESSTGYRQERSDACHHLPRPWYVFALATNSLLVCFESAYTNHYPGRRLSRGIGFPPRFVQVSVFPHDI